MSSGWDAMDDYAAALARHDPDPMRAYVAGHVERVRARGGIPDPHAVARAEGRQATPAEIEAWERSLGIPESQREGARSAVGSSRPRSRPSWSLGERSTAITPPARGRSRSRVVEETPPHGGRWWDSAAEDDRADKGEPARAWCDGFTIKVAPNVFSKIEREIREAIWRFDTNEVESGGWLYGHYAADAEGVTVVHATGPGPFAEHRADDSKLELKLSHPRHFEGELPSSTLLVGDWHAHPWRSRSDPTDQASDADEKAWRNHRETLASCSRYVGLIFTPGASMGWTAPVYHGFLTHKNEGGVVVCEQAAVAEAGIAW